MLTWERRPVEVANLLNPAFCSLLLRGAIDTFQAENDEGMAYPLSFVLLPLVLHKPTRQTLPRTTRTRLHVWLQEKPEVRIGFIDRIRQLVPYTREALIFGMQSQFITIDENGNLIPVRKRVKNLPWPNDSESSICYKQAQFVGRWLAQAGSTSTIFTTLGIRL